MTNILILITSFSLTAISIFAYLNSSFVSIQPVSQYLPRHKHKHVPIFGGVFIAIPFFLISWRYYFVDLFWLYGVISSAVIIGLSDDILKLKFQNNTGISKKVKFMMEFIMILPWVVYKNVTWADFHQFTTFSYSALFDKLNLSILNEGVTLLAIVLWQSFIILGGINSVNFADGLDGLAIGITLPIAIFLYAIASTALQPIIIALIGGMLGFLIFNLNPAKIFLGEVGPMLIGSFISATAIHLNSEWIFAFASLVLIIETLSVAAQIISVYIFKKRILYKMPIHHTFEEMIEEKSTVLLFTTCSILVCFWSLLIYNWWFSAQINTNLFLIYFFIFQFVYILNIIYAIDDDK